MPTNSDTGSRTVRVHLADAPTDVLVWLVERQQHLWWSVGQIATATAPDDADHAEATVANALSLLRRLGYVVQNPETRAATTDGQRAVEVAAANPQPSREKVPDA